MTAPLCKGCKQPTHPSYIARYNGFCLDCDNAGVPDLMEELDGMRGELRQSNEAIAALQLKVDILEAANANLSAQLQGKFEYVGQDFAYRIRAKDEKIENLKTRLRLNQYVCEVCFNSSFEPCAKETKGAVKDPSLEAIDGYMCCAYCAMYEGLSQKETEIQRLIDMNQTIARDVTNGTMDSMRRRIMDVILGSGLSGIYDTFDNEMDAVRQMVQRVKEVEGELESETRREKQYHDDWVKARDDVKTLREALELYALEENWSSEGEYTRSAGVINSNGGEDERTYTIELDSRTVFVGNQMGDDEGWKIAKETLEAISEI